MAESLENLTAEKAKLEKLASEIKNAILRVTIKQARDSGKIFPDIESLKAHFHKQSSTKNVIGYQIIEEDGNLYEDYQKLNMPGFKRFRNRIYFYECSTCEGLVIGVPDKRYDASTTEEFAELAGNSGWNLYCRVCDSFLCSDPGDMLRSVSLTDR
ncbi:MAG: hypothetical protein ABIH72_00385 [archaeon]